jgi:hypothetical protein
MIGGRGRASASPATLLLLRGDRKRLVHEARSHTHTAGGRPILSWHAKHFYLAGGCGSNGIALHDSTALFQENDCACFAQAVFDIHACPFVHRSRCCGMR